MADLISRQAAIDAIEIYIANNTSPDFQGNGHWVEGAETAERIIKDLPSVQPEQHLCRECKWVKYYGKVDKYGTVESHWHCINWDGGTDEEGYCHEWERREHETD